MKTIFAFLTWLGVTLIEGAVFYAMWRWFIEDIFTAAPALAYPEALGVIIAARLFIPDQLLQKATREPGKGDPLLDLAFLRIKIAVFLIVIGGIVHLASPLRGRASRSSATTSGAKIGADAGAPAAAPKTDFEFYFP